MQYVLIRFNQFITYYDSYEEQINTDYLCTGTITEVLSAINENIKTNYKNIKADTFKVYTEKCVRIGCDLESEYIDCESESMFWLIIPTNKTNISIW